MVLTKSEKKALAVPVLMALVIMGVLGYNWHLSSQAEILQEMIDKTGAKIREGRSTLQSLEGLDEKELFSLQYQLDEWIPLFENFVEAKLCLTRKVHAALCAVGAEEKDWILSPSDAGTTPFLGTVQLDALFPSYAALLRFIGEMEDSPPPLLPQETAIQKNGIKLNVSLTMYFAYRLKDETI
jgi:hypothetical protein